MPKYFYMRSLCVNPRCLQCVRRKRVILTSCGHLKCITWIQRLNEILHVDRPAVKKS